MRCISWVRIWISSGLPSGPITVVCSDWYMLKDRKSTRLNSSHANISYAVFCLKKKKSLLLLPPGRDRAIRRRGIGAPITRQVPLPDQDDQQPLSVPTVNVNEPVDPIRTVRRIH